MQDSELVDQIVIHACSNHPQSVTVDLMKEFLLGIYYTFSVVMLKLINFIV